MATEIIERAVARAIGRVTYFLGTPCRHGHVAERYGSDERCVECSKLRDKKRRAKFSEKRCKSREEIIERRKAYYRQWSIENADRVKAYTSKWAKENPEKRREAAQRFRAKNRDKLREKNRKWRTKNPGRIRQHNAKRRAKKLEAGGSYTHEQILNLFKKQKGRCANCFCSIKRGWHNDHIIALARGGSNDISNIQLLCQPCNSRKHAKDPIVWAQENGRLL